MKRIGNLYERIVDLDNLRKASSKAQKGKSRSKEVIKWNLNLYNNILELHYSLLNKKYEVPEYHIFKIHEPKERIISKLPFRDRIVHHAIMNIIEPVLNNSLISQTYSCIKRRGIHKCLRSVNKALKDVKNTQYCLKLDIKKFYPSINNTLLKNIIRKKFKDDRLLWLLDIIIDSCEGLPLGNYTSQWLANLYLNDFDHWLKEKMNIKYYFRYCDDLVILHKNKEYLHYMREEIQIFLSKIHLQLSNYQVFPTESRGINFVGYISYHNYIRLRKSIKLRIKKMLLKYPNYKSINSYLGWTLHANCRHLEKKLNLK